MQEYDVLHRANRRRPSFNSRAIVRAASQASTASDKRAAETDAKLKRLYDAIENGIVGPGRPYAEGPNCRAEGDPGPGPRRR